MGVRNWGPAAAAVLALVVAPVVPAGAGLSVPGKFALATAVFAGVLWVSGAIPLAVTSLLVPVVLTVLGVYPDMGRALSGFADPVLFLVLSGFVLAAALRARGLDRRLACHVLALTGGTPRRLVGGVMLVSAGLSTVVSNAATVATMVPVAVGLVERTTDGTLVGEGRGIATDVDYSDRSADREAATPAEATSEDHHGDERPAENLQVALVLGVAYAASIGGVATLVGAPSNAVVTGQVGRLLDVRITFLDWLVVGVPTVAVTLPLAWYLLVYRVVPPRVDDWDVRERARRKLDASGTLDRRSRRVLLVFAGTAALWVFGGLGVLFEGVLPPAWHATLFGGPGETVLGVTGHQGALSVVVVGLGAILALVLSGGADWAELTEIDWSTLLTLGGGLSLGDALVATDAAEWLADGALTLLGGTPLVAVILAVVALVVITGELAASAAMTAVFVPILVKIGPTYATELGVPPAMAATFVAIAGGVAASYGFALPVATPPNAIAYGTGYVSRAHMLRAGAVLDAVMILVVTLVLSGAMWSLWPIVL